MDRRVSVTHHALDFPELAELVNVSLHVQQVFSLLRPELDALRAEDPVMNRHNRRLKAVPVDGSAAVLALHHLLVLRFLVFVIVQDLAAHDASAVVARLAEPTNGRQGEHAGDLRPPCRLEAQHSALCREFAI